MSEESDLSEFEMVVLNSILDGKRSVREISRHTGLPEMVVHSLIEKLNRKGFLKGLEPVRIPELTYRHESSTDGIDIFSKFIDVAILALIIILGVLAIDFFGLI